MPIDTPSNFGGQSRGLVLAGHFNEPDTYVTCRPQGMSDWLITFTLAGEGSYIVNGSEERRCRAGDLALLRPETPHQYGTAPGHAWNFLWAHFHGPDLPAAILPTEELTISPIENSTSRKRMYRAFKRILADSRERGPYWHELCIAALKEVLMLHDRGQSTSFDPRIEETLHWLSRHMREPVRIDTLARSIGLSASRLSHLFKEQTGESIIESLNRMRIRQAALLLQHTDRTAAEAAYDVGFHNYNHFINQFRKSLGVSPSAYKKRPSANSPESSIQKT